MMRRFLVMIALLLMPISVAAIGVDEKQLDDPQLEAQAREIMKDLRCLVCQNQSIEDSNADLARDLRAVVRDRVAAGDSPAAVKTYMVDRYGDWVLLQPPFKTSTLVLWLGPALFLIVAGFIGWRMVSRRGDGQDDPENEFLTGPLSAAEEARLEAILGRTEGRDPEHNARGDGGSGA